MKSSRDKSQRRWTLMVIGDHGKVIELKHIRWLIGATMTVLVGAILAAAVLFGYNQKLSYTNKKLRESLEISETRVTKVRQQADLLMAQLALAEAKAKDITRQPSTSEANSPETIAGPQQTAAPQPQQTAPSPPVAGKPPEPEPTIKTAAKPKQAKPAPLPEPVLTEAPQDLVIVEIGELELTRPAGSGMLNLEFQLRNVSPEPHRIEGRVVAVLKGDGLLPNEWVTLPKVDLVDGRPSENKGYRFAINNWRTMRLKTNFAGSLEHYNVAEIYVFSREGDVLLREVYPVTPQ